jgi:hypothetical protein
MMLLCIHSHFLDTTTSTNPSPSAHGVETDWKRKLGQSNMICVQEMRMNTKEHHAVYRAILISGGGGGPAQFFFCNFLQFFSTCEKITQFLSFGKYQGGPS